MANDDTIDDMDEHKAAPSDITSSPTIGFADERGRPSEAGGRILFAPDPRDRERRRSEVATLPLTRTFSRQSRFSSYSATSDDERQKVRRVTSRRVVEPHTRLPTSIHLLLQRLIVSLPDT
jgi:hypothetical protein